MSKSKKTTGCTCGAAKKITDVTNVDDLREFMTTPTDALVKMMAGLAGDVMVLGCGGKVGPELVETLMRANRQAGARRTFYGVDLFPDGSPVQPDRFEALGAKVVKGDLTSSAFIASLPDAPNIIYMVGFKFGSSKNYRATWHINAILPYLIGARFGSSRIVVFSSTNPYPHLPPASGGAKEEDDLDPTGVYGWSIVARESAFLTTQIQSPAQKLLFYRLAYAQHLGYGVLVDLARMIQKGETISLSVPAVNVMSQRDAIDVAVRSLQLAANPGVPLNCAGPVWLVRDVAARMSKILGKQPVYAADEGTTAFLANDAKCRSLLGEYRDAPEDLITAAANWVKRGGEYWDKPTMFGRADHKY